MRRPARVVPVHGFGDGLLTLEPRIVMSTGMPVMDFARFVSDTRAVDVNGDGHLDVVAFANRAIGIALSDGSGGYLTPRYVGFNDPVIDFAIGDLDNDGDGDLVVLTGDRLVRVYDDGPSAYFTRRTLFHMGYRATSITVGHFNNDGLLDAAVMQPPVPGRAVPTVRLILQDGMGGLIPGLGRPTPYTHGRLSIAQIRPSMTDEIVMTTPQREVAFEVGVIRLKVIGDEPRLNVAETAIGDVNQDGHPDYAFGSFVIGGPRISIALRDDASPIGFTEQVVYSGPAVNMRAVGLADLTGDGRLDVVVIGELPGAGGLPNTIGVYLLRQGMDGQFGQPEFLVDLPPFFDGLPINSVRILGYSDTNGDGTPDVIIENYSEFRGEFEYAVRAIESPDPMGMDGAWSRRAIYPDPFVPLNGVAANAQVVPDLLGSGLDGLLVRNARVNGRAVVEVCLLT